MTGSVMEAVILVRKHRNTSCGTGHSARGKSLHGGQAMSSDTWSEDQNYSPTTLDVDPPVLVRRILTIFRQNPTNPDLQMQAWGDYYPN